MIKQKTILIIIILFLLVSNIYFGFRYFIVQKDLRQTQLSLKSQQTNERILEFSKLFIDKVLKAKTEVDFETRLKLETAVRNLKDEEILVQWQKFTESKTEDGAQENVKNLLEILINKIEIQ